LASTPLASFVSFSSLPEAESWRDKNNKDLWYPPLPIIDTSAGPPYNGPRFQPGGGPRHAYVQWERDLDLLFDSLDIEPTDRDQLDRSPSSPACALGESFRFRQIIEGVECRRSHRFEAGSAIAPWERLCSAVLDLQHEFFALHPVPSREDVAAFWSSYEAVAHITKLGHRITEIHQGPRESVDLAVHEKLRQVTAYIERVKVWADSPTDPRRSAAPLTVVFANTEIHRDTTINNVENVQTTNVYERNEHHTHHHVLNASATVNVTTQAKAKRGKQAVNGTLEKLQKRVRKLWNDQKTALEICRLLDNEGCETPPQVTWKHRTWVDNYKDRSQRGKVKTWISKACPAGRQAAAARSVVADKR
jgi:hypothetical protein